MKVIETPKAPIYQPQGILIIGGGVIVQTLVKELLAFGKNVIIVTNRFQEECKAINHVNLKILSRQNFLRKFSTYSVDLAVIAARPDRWNDDSNLTQIFTRLYELNPGQVVLLSSSAIYGNSNKPFLETSQPAPLSDYGKSKLLLEFSLFKLFKYEQLAILRISNVYGNENLSSVIEDLVKNIKINSNEELNLNTQAQRDYVYIDDLISGVLRVIDDRLTGYFNISTGVGVNINELVPIINEKFGCNLGLKESQSYPEIARCVILDNTKFKCESGWSPREPIQGILDYIKTCLER